MQLSSTRSMCMFLVNIRYHGCAGIGAQSFFVPVPKTNDLKLALLYQVRVQYYWKSYIKRRKNCNFDAYHETEFGVCVAFCTRHLSVTELPDWAWMSGLPSMITSGTKTQCAYNNLSFLFLVKQYRSEASHKTIFHAAFMALLSKLFVAMYYHYS